MNRIEEERHIRSVFRQVGFHKGLVTDLRDIAIKHLQPVINKVPVPISDTSRAAYAAKGISTEWNLAITGENYANGARAFWGTSQRIELSKSQRSAVELLFACSEALEANALSDRVRQNILDAYIGLDLDDVIKGKKFPTGKRAGALKKTTAYLVDLRSRYPYEQSKQLYRIACDEAESEKSPFTYDRADGGILLDGDEEVDIEKFADRLSKAKNRHMR